MTATLTVTGRSAPASALVTAVDALGADADVCPGRDHTGRPCIFPRHQPTQVCRYLGAAGDTADEAGMGEPTDVGTSAPTSNVRTVWLGAEPPYRQIPASTGPEQYIGSNKERQSIGNPGHCERCVSVGHEAAHPQLGCGDVGCYADHEPSSPAGSSTTAGEEDSRG